MEIVLRATIIYFFLWAVMRGLGKRELSEMSAFEMILVVIFGDIVQQGITQEDMSLTGAILSVGTIAVWISLLGWITFRFKKTRRVIEGIPAVLVHEGEFLDEVLRTERVTREEVLAEARTEGIQDISDVRYAVLEVPGHISFVLRDEPDPPFGPPTQRTE